MKKRIVTLSILLPVVGFLFSCQSSHTGNPVSANHTQQIYGFLYNNDGTPAVNARVSLIPSNSIPAGALFKKADAAISKSSELKTGAATADGVTDENGRYSFSYVPSDTYNIYGDGNGNLSYHPFVTVTSDKNSVLVANDTLCAPGSLKGSVVTNPPGDSRRIFILVVGGYIVRWPDDSAGNFTLSNMAEGTYNIRFLPTDQNSPIFDTIVTISSGKETDIGTIVLETSTSKQAEIDSAEKAILDLIHTEKDSTVKSYLKMKFGALVYFNLGTFSVDSTTLPEKPSPYSDENLFKPNLLDCGQWADAVKASGAKYIILTVRDQDGFCLWNTSYTLRDVGSCSWAQGKRDIVKEFTDSARTRGLKVGFYYTLLDLFCEETVSLVKTQLKDLLSNYGDITCLMIDGLGNDPYKDEIYSYVYSLQKNCVVIESENKCSKENTDIVGCYHLANTGYEKDYTKLLDWDAPPVVDGMKAEAIESIHPWYWYWHKNIYLNNDTTDTLAPHINNCDLLVPQRIVDRMNACNALNENYVLSVCPDTTGLLPQCQVECLKSVGALRGIH
jgi:hypothetical protein